MTTSATLLNDALRAFSTNGPGYVPLTASSTGVRMSDEALLQFVVPTWGNANNILILPTPAPGKIVIVAGAATGGEIRTTSPTTIGINGGVGANAESAIAANMMAIFICESLTSWKGFTLASNGDIAKVEVAAP